MPNPKCKPLPDLSEVDIARFWSKVEKQGPDECWPWIGGRFSRGYGTFCVAGQTVQAHRVAYMLATDVDPFPYLVCHTCDNPPCCNASHYFPGNNQSNTADRHQKGRTAIGDKSGRRLHPDNYWQKGERHLRPGAILTPDQVVEIRQLHQNGLKGIELARKYAVTTGTVSMIINRIIWKHLP